MQFWPSPHHVNQIKQIKFCASCIGSSALEYNIPHESKKLQHKTYFWSLLEAWTTIKIHHDGNSYTKKDQKTSLVIKKRIFWKKN
ncbi:hypothetical protein GDO81_001044 [Engystomops pustulosus]|uniref:Uncharacterized protein n=1 Tax=Engystomops pustulosus TaxID=76066 RepID=A0AAV7D9C6_ENGPU|nr:hypothetical protein GDO81_001044 [Engystomops pustulosus]